MIAVQHPLIACGQKTLTQRLFVTSTNDALGDAAVGMLHGWPCHLFVYGNGVLKFSNLLPTDLVEFTSREPEAALAEFTVQAIYRGGRVRFKVGGEHSIVPKRGKPSVRVKWPEGRRAADPPILVCPETKAEGEVLEESLGFSKLRVRVTALHVGRLQAMTDADVLAEGVATREEYAALWQKINGKGAWDKNPFVVRVGFERVVRS